LITLNQLNTVAPRIWFAVIPDVQCAGVHRRLAAPSGPYQQFLGIAVIPDKYVELMERVEIASGVARGRAPRVTAGAECDKRAFPRAQT
jgi:hypothetical protein